MTADLESLLAPLRHEGPRLFAHWNAGLFDAVAHGPAQQLFQQLQGQPQATAVLKAYLHLIQQAIGTTLLRQAEPSTTGWTCFLERCLVQLIPELLPREMPEQQLPLLARVWNLGEGLRREPEWLDRYVGACAGGLESLLDLEGFLVRTLEPVLTPAPPAAWKGPFSVQVLDFRPVHEEFLPGVMSLAAPCVLCVQDRRLAGVQIGIMLQPGQRTRILGLTRGLGEYMEEGERPYVNFADQSVLVGKQATAVPLLRSVHRHLVAGAGFIAASAVDSQRLWIVESP